MRSRARKTRTTSALKPGEVATSTRTDQDRAVSPVSSASSRAAAVLGVLAVDVHQPGRQFPEAAAQRVPVLLDHDHRSVIVQGNDRDGAVVLDDLPRGDAATGHDDIVDADVHHQPVVDAAGSLDPEQPVGAADAAGLEEHRFGGRPRVLGGRQASGRRRRVGHLEAIGRR